MRTSSAGIALIKKFEGCRLEAYQDVVGVWTIGYGDTMNVRPATRITQQQAEDRLTNRLAREFEPGVLDALQGAPATQPQFDAMVSLSWNIGIGAFAKSSVARFHRDGDYATAADAFLLWNKAGGNVISGLVRRREEERSLYLSEASPVSEIPAPAPANDNRPDRDLVADLVRALQRVVDTNPDGVLGPHTITAIQSAQRKSV
jgi:lysozyme